MLVLLITVATAAHADADPEIVLRQIRNAQPDLSGPLDPSGLRLSTGFATLDLIDGALIPVRTTEGQAVEMIFVGEGQARLVPPDDIEASQLELFTGARALAETFSEAVFVVARDDAADALLRRPPLNDIEPATLERARERYAKWKDSPERSTLGVETGILIDALGDSLYEEYFAGWFLGEDLGPFLLQMDPAAEEQINLGQFVRFEVTPEERQSLTRYLHRQQKQGKLIGLELEDIGRWDSWILTPTRSPEGQLRRGSAGFEPKHYVLDVTVDPRNRELTSKSRVEMIAARGGRRVIPLELHRDLEIRRVNDGEGRELFFLRDGNTMQVILPYVPESGSRVVLELECHGEYLDQGSAQNWALRDSLGWYPRSGPNERATYDVTLRWPRRYNLVSSGRKVDNGNERGLKWERRKMDVPALGFTFEVGRFETSSTRIGHVDIHLAVDSSSAGLAAEKAREQMLSVIGDALSFYEKTFGPYPLDELTVVSVPRQFSQAMLGFITLSGRVMVDFGVFAPVLGVQDPSSIVAHEVAHQWWGHLVGWRSYRDQWISEAMANYAAVLWARHRGLRPSVGPVTGWQQELTATLADGRSVESLGPMVLGERLFSSRSQDAYHAIVYRKGALVLEMLARKFGEDTFLKALRAMIDSVSGQVISTDDFLNLLEQITATDLDAFAEQFIFGTGLPEIYYDYEFEPTDDGRWRIRVETVQEMPTRFRYGVVLASDGQLDVARSQISPSIDVESSELVVPFQIRLAKDRDRRSAAHQLLIGRMVISGRQTELEFVMDQQPSRLWLDRDHEVFGRFLDKRKHPKRMLFNQARKQAASGGLEAAKVTLERALNTRSPLASTDYMLDAHLHLQLSSVLLDEQDSPGAVQSLDAARRALERGGAELPESEKRRFARAFEMLEARMEIRRGDYEAAWQRLGGGILDPRDATSTEGYLLLAIAAKETDRRRELEEAVRVARERGADVSWLRSALLASAAPAR